MKRFRLIAIAAAAFLAAGALPLTATAPAHADDQLTTLQNFYNANDVGQGSVTLSSTDVSYLRGAQATFGGSGLNVQGDSVHGLPVAGWNSTSQSFSWPVTSASAASYEMNVLIANASGTIIISDGSASISKTFTSTDNGWDKVDFGALAIPAGKSTLTIKSTNTTGPTMSLLSIETTPVAAASSIASSIAASKSTATWMKSSPVGVFYQWGQWGANQDGSQPAWPTVYQNANFNQLAARDKAMGASYVVWSVTWTSYYVAAPISSVDSVLSGRTTSHDYLQDMITAYKNQGMRVVFYYHDGHDANPNADWWNSFWGTTASTGYDAQKAASMNKWLNIIREIGLRYGTQLDGWMFDDGGTYYPAPEALVDSALRAGNPQRMYSFNSNFNGPRLTDRQDFYFGEQSDLTDNPVDANGTITSGPYAGEQNFANIQEDCGDWGVRAGDTATITPCRSQEDLNGFAHRAAATHSSVAIDQRMWADLSRSPNSISEFAVATRSANGFDEKSTIDDGSSAVTFSSGWQNSNPGGCFNSTCHNIQSAGATATVSFTGSGISWNGITGPDQGTATVSIDGGAAQTVNLVTPTRATNTTVFSAGVAYGTHTMKITTTSSAWVTIDDFVVNTSQFVDDSSSAVTYDSSWVSSNPGSCEQRTCHNAKTAGATATATFTGTQVTWYSITGPDQGSADVYIDGALDRTVNLVTPSRGVGTPVFTRLGLASGNHTIKIVTKSTGYVSIDGFGVGQSAAYDDSNAGLTYSSGWTNSNPGGCLNNTCHNTQTAGSTVSFSTNATFVTLYGIEAQDQGAFDVYVNGNYVQTVDLYGTGRFVGVPVWSSGQLAAGTKTIKLISDNSGWFSVDAMTQGT